MLPFIRRVDYCEINESIGRHDEHLRCELLVVVPQSRDHSLTIRCSVKPPQKGESFPKEY